MDMPGHDHRHSTQHVNGEGVAQLWQRPNSERRISGLEPPVLAQTQRKSSWTDQVAQSEQVSCRWSEFSVTRMATRSGHSSECMQRPTNPYYRRSVTSPAQSGLVHLIPHAEAAEEHKYEHAIQS